jgi:protein-disulfide isomerase
MHRQNIPNAVCGVGLVAIIVCAVVISTRSEGAKSPAGPQPSTVPSTRISIDGAQFLGNPQARAAIIEFADFQCIYCAQFVRNTFADLRTKYIDSGQVAFVFMHLPMTVLHPLAIRAAEAAECAGAINGNFWDYHDKLFGEVSLSADVLRRLAIGARVSVGVAFDRCMQGQMREKVAAHTALAYALGIDGTPAFIVGTLDSYNFVQATSVLRGAQSLEEFERVLSPIVGSVTNRGI